MLQLSAAGVTSGPDSMGNRVLGKSAQRVKAASLSEPKRMACVAYVTRGQTAYMVKW